MGCEVEEVPNKQADSIEAKQFRKGFDVNTESQQTATNGTKLLCDILYSRTMATGGLEPTGLNAIDTIETKGQHSCQNGKANSDKNENSCDNGQCSNEEQSKQDHCESTKTENADDQKVKTENAEDQKVKTEDDDASISSRGACGGASSENECTREIEADIIKKLSILKEQLGKCSDIEEILFDVPLSCLKDKTLTNLCYHLDIENEIMTSDDKLRDYRGMGEWIGLEAVFIRYVSGAVSQFKTKEIISKWMTIDEPKPTLGNLRKCLLDMDRPDVLEDMAVTISKDGTEWRITNFEAKKGIGKSTVAQDTSWQLTRHDVVSGEPTYYTCCLVYADEDEQMASTITKLYSNVYAKALFFRPQFDLKNGKYVYETTAQVIEERCGGKAVFLVSEYFLASDVCRFAVHFCKDMEGSSEQGNLIPFNLTNDDKSIPRVLKGITGIRWYRQNARSELLLMLTDALLGGKMPEAELEELKQNMTDVIKSNPEMYLSDPVYDANTPKPGIPISVYDPPPEVENSDDPSSRLFEPAENECLMARSLTSLEQLGLTEKRSRLWRARHYVRKHIISKVFGPRRQRTRPPVQPHTSSFPV